MTLVRTAYTNSRHSHRRDRARMPPRGRTPKAAVSGPVGGRGYSPGLRVEKAALPDTPRLVPRRGSIKNDSEVKEKSKPNQTKNLQQPNPCCWSYSLRLSPLPSLPSPSASLSASMLSLSLSLSLPRHPADNAYPASPLYPSPCPSRSPAPPPPPHAGCRASPPRPTPARRPRAAWRPQAAVTPPSCHPPRSALSPSAGVPPGARRARRGRGRPAKPPTLSPPPSAPGRSHHYRQQ